MAVYFVHPDVIHAQRRNHPLRLIVSNAHVKPGEQWVVEDRTVTKEPIDTTQNGIPRETDDAPSPEAPADH